MADVIHIQRGFAPWQPAPDAVLVKEYQYYEMPTRGVIEQHGVRFLFICAPPSDDELTGWVYFHLSPREEEMLDNATPEEFENAIVHTGPCVMAFAVDGLGVVRSYVLDELSQVAFNDVADQFSQELGQIAEHAREIKTSLL
jgi:hypothetical protein